MLEQAGIGGQGGLQRGHVIEQHGCQPWVGKLRPSRQHHPQAGGEPVRAEVHLHQVRHHRLAVDAVPGIDAGVERRGDAVRVVAFDGGQQQGVT